MPQPERSEYTIASAVDGMQALKVLDNEGVVDLVISG